MFTTLKGDPALRSVNEAEFCARLARFGFANDAPRHYMLVRHPYARVISFFYDKLRHDLRDREKSSWQYSQRRLFPLAGVSGREDFETIRSALLKIELSAFIEFLPRITANRHLRPQTHIISGVAGLFLRETHFLRMEYDLEALHKIFGVNIRIKRNRTSHPDAPSLLTRNDREILNSVYARDFDALPYESA